MVDWNKIRQQFPATKKYTYLNAAQKGKRFYDEIMARGDLVWDEWLDRKEDVRKKIAKFINADKSEIAFTLNTSHGMNLIAEILQKRGEVITMDDEFPSSTFPWLNNGYKVHFIKPKNAVYLIEDIDKKNNKKTKIIVTSYVQYCTGFRQDLIELGKLCKKKGLIFVVNATQAIGAMPVDVKKANIDFLVFTSLKWLMAGYGIGVLYMSKKWFNKIHYPIAGWQSVKNPDLMDNKKLELKREASELEVGCPHFPNIFALGGALDLLNKIGRENIQKRIFELDDYLAEKLKAMNLEVISPLAKKYRSGITIIKIKNAKEIVS